MTDKPRLLVIHNPISGRRRGTFLKQVLGRLERAGCEIDVRQTGGRGDAEALARDADPERFSAVVVAGGDGTINEVINGLDKRTLPLGLIPMGTANVLAAELSLPESAEGVADVLLAQRLRRICVGNASGRRFAMMAGVGFDAHVVANLNTGLKRLLGKGAYVLQCGLEFLRYRSTLYRLRVDNTEWEAASAVIANGHYYGGRFVCAPDARLDDPKLHVCMFGRAGRFHVIRYSSALLLGRLHKLPDVTVVPASRVMVVDSEGEPVQGDGDIIANLPAEISIDRDGIDVIVP